MNRPVLSVHGGAGGHTDELREHAAEYHAALEGALAAGADALNAGGGAVEAVRAAVIVLESVPLFNAGYGSALCADGSVELSASVMRGSDQAAGGVAMMTRTAHPVAAAVALLDEPEVLLVGPSADAHAAANGLEQCDPVEFVTERQRQKLAEHLAAAEPETVGAVCLDKTGLLAAATSTGGLSGQRLRPGRRFAADRRRYVGRQPRGRFVHRAGGGVHPRRRGAARGGPRRAWRDARMRRATRR